MSFLIADSDQELHTAADRIGMPRQTFPSGRTHYYYVPTDKALKLYAKQVSREEILRILSKV